ncbi:MAG: hypothetical protein AB7I27_15645 [Bacteriovoracaceae bacterium]
MLGLLVIGFTVIMIFNLVKNALIGKQFSREDSFNGPIELLVPIGPESDFYLDHWLKSLNSLHFLSDRLKIHLLVYGPNTTIKLWDELKDKLPFVQLHVFSQIPENELPVPWILSQVAPKINSSVVVIGDPELVPKEEAFISIGKIVTETNNPYFVLPQTNQQSALGEALATLNPTLALTSVFGFKKFSKNISHPMISYAQGWMGMPLSTFQALDFSIKISSWKELISYQWNIQNKNYYLAFGEKFLIRFYPEDLQSQILKMKLFWNELWNNPDRTSMFLFTVSIFIWSFPVLCLITHPFWSFASFLLLMVYRFFSKIVFQERWSAFFLHPIASLAWPATLMWWAIEGLKAKYGTKDPT